MNNPTKPPTPLDLEQLGWTEAYRCDIELEMDLWPYVAEQEELERAEQHYAQHPDDKIEETIASNNTTARLIEPQAEMDF